MKKRVSIVIDYNLWSDNLEAQMNAIEQGLMNAKGKTNSELYPIQIIDYDEEIDTVDTKANEFMNWLEMRLHRLNSMTYGFDNKTEIARIDGQETILGDVLSKFKEIIRKEE